MKDLRLVYL